MALNVIALVSGGKDSFFSILHCIANGHKIVALANLHPSTGSDNEDINSYMYQTVGHSVIPLYEQALGIPLYRQEITGKAVNAERDYSAPQAQQEQDETEDLVPLLRKAMLAHPEANAVSTGAILSTYQRTRVESVSLRLGLTPLSYLWQYPLLPPYSQSQLLYDMAAVGQEAIVIKTASGGLDERILGWNVAAPSTITKLQKAMARFGEESNGAVLGEGGEYETLALDGPKPLWKKRIRIEPGAAGVSEAGQSVLKMRASELEEKSEDDDQKVKSLRIPDMFDDEFKRILEEQESADDTRSFISDAATLLNEPLIDLSPFDHLPRNASSDTPSVFTYSNLSDTARSSMPSPARQLTKILLRLDHVLRQWNLSRAAINHCTLLLRSMTDFSVLNPIYAQYFCLANPPARVTVAVGPCMPAGLDVMLSITVDKDSRSRKGKLIRAVNRQALHVQGHSYWAPANIGPYSQAVSAQLPCAAGGEERAGKVVYVAGQIPLVPASMQVYTERGFKGQVTLALQHLCRVGRAKGVRWWTAAVGFIPAGEHPEVRVNTAQSCWLALHSRLEEEEGDASDDDTLDPWDALNTAHTQFTDSPPRAPVPDPSVFSAETQRPSTPPCFIAQISSLPRAADIEWSATGLTSTSMSQTLNPSHGVTVLAPLHSATRFVTIVLPLSASTAQGTEEEEEEEGEVDLSALLRLPTGRACTSATLYKGRGLRVGRLARGVQWVPCERVWGEGGREVGGVVVGRWDGEEGET